MHHPPIRVHHPAPDSMALGNPQDLVAPSSSHRVAFHVLEEDASLTTHFRAVPQ